jgi:hypothetical protein
MWLEKIVRLKASCYAVIRYYYGDVGKKKNAYRILVGKPEGKRPHGSC